MRYCLRPAKPCSCVPSAAVVWLSTAAPLSSLPRMRPMASKRIRARSREDRCAHGRTCISTGRLRRCPALHLLDDALAPARHDPCWRSAPPRPGGGGAESLSRWLTAPRFPRLIGLVRSGNPARTSTAPIPSTPPRCAGSTGDAAELGAVDASDAVIGRQVLVEEGVVRVPMMSVSGRSLENRLVKKPRHSWYIALADLGV